MTEDQATNGHPAPAESNEAREARLMRETAALLKQAREKLFELALLYGATGRTVDHMDATAFSLQLAAIIGPPAHEEAARDCRMLRTLHLLNGQRDEAERVSQLALTRQAAAQAKLKARAEECRALGLVELREEYERRLAEARA